MDSKELAEIVCSPRRGFGRCFCSHYRSPINAKGLTMDSLKIILGRIVGSHLLEAGWT